MRNMRPLSMREAPPPGRGVRGGASSGSAYMKLNIQHAYKYTCTPIYILYLPPIDFRNTVIPTYVDHINVENQSNIEYRHSYLFVQFLF